MAAYFRVFTFDPYDDGSHESSRSFDSEIEAFKCFKEWTTQRCKYTGELPDHSIGLERVERLQYYTGRTEARERKESDHA